MTEPGSNRTVPRGQIPQITSRLDNYIDNSKRMNGKPNLTDETDVFDELYKETKIQNKKIMDQHSIQNWNDK